MVANAMQAAELTLETRPLKSGFGVEVLGFDFPTASEQELLAFDAIQRSNAIVVLRDQKLTPAQVHGALAAYGQGQRATPRRPAS